MSLASPIMPLLSESIPHQLTIGSMASDALNFGSMVQFQNPVTTSYGYYYKHPMTSKAKGNSETTSKGKGKGKGKDQLDLNLQESFETFLVPLLAWAACFAPMLFLFYWFVPEPYMDEVFHIPQAQAFCDGKWDEYDPKITTGPFLYLYSVYLAKVVSALTLFKVPVASSSVLCSPLFLRGTVYLLHCLTSSLIHMLLLALQPVSPPTRRAAKTLELSLFPIHFFFSFLYYTDVLSTFLVLLLYLLSLHGHHLQGGTVGLLALLTRQTNIAWVLWVFGCAVLRDYEAGELEVETAEELGETELAILLRPFFYSQALPAGLHFAMSVWRHREKLFLSYWPYLLDAWFFFCFVFFNQGVALGDRSNHQAILHVPQLCYFMLFLLFFSGCSGLQPRRAKEFLRDCWWILRDASAAFFVAQGLLFMGQAIQHYTYSHPFLLADNRHYTFYLWKAFRARPSWFKFALTPLYVYGFWFMYRMLAGRRSVLWQMNFLACLALAVVPAPLIEFRYFLTPFLLLQLHDGLSNQTGLLLNVAGGALVNFFTVYMFCLRPFWWADGSIARFMW
eukprot:g73718.t1